MEFQNKENRIWEYIEKKNADGLLLSRRDSFAWISCGGISGVEKCMQNGVVDILFFRGRKYLIASTIEKFRFVEEELKGKDFQLLEYEWYEDKYDAISHFIDGKNIISDTGIFNTIEDYKGIQRMRYSLEEEEVARLRNNSRIFTKAMEEVCYEITPNDSEWEVAANINNKLMSNGFEVPVCLIASDERINNFRHPIPTDKKINKHVMVVAGAEKNGLVLSITRIVHFGKLSEDLIRRHKACLTVDATFIHNTFPGAKICDTFLAGIEAYKECGYPEEWKLHHQGGAAGYRSREYIADLNCSEVVHNNQMFAWNPTITGTKSEDTILITQDGKYEVLTELDRWPVMNIQVDDKSYKRPDILIR